MAADDFFVLHLVDSADWVADHERTLCNVCTRPFGTFRRKHHCRMCGEVVCKNCTLYKDAHVDPTISPTRVRVCMSCVINSSNNQRSDRSPGAPSPNLNASSEASRLWMQSHLLSPSSSPPSEPDSEELLRSLTPKPRHHLDLKDGHFNAEGESRKSRKRNLQANQPNSEPLSDWVHPWPRPPVSSDEGDRLRALYALGVLDSESENPFNMICDLAKARLSCPMAAVSFLDEHRQWFKASVGLAHKMIPRKIAFCAYTVFMREPMVVLDTLQDPRFRRNPLVSGAAGVRFYAAAPILDPNTGHAVGSVFVLDTRPREACDISILERLALAAGENLPMVSNNNEKKDEPDNNAVEEAEGQGDSEQAHDHSTSTNPAYIAAQNELQSFDSKKIGVPMSPATPTSTSSTSSVASGPSNQAAMSAAKVEDNNDSENTQEGERSLAMTQLSMGTTSGGEQMEVLLMRLLTQNTETQQQLAVQQISLSAKLGEHTHQINKLMSDFARMEAKVEAKVDSRAN